MLSKLLADEKVRKTVITVERLLLWGSLISVGFFGSISLLQFKEKVKEEIRLERIQEKKSDQEYFGKIIAGMSQQFIELRNDLKDQDEEYQRRFGRLEDMVNKNGRDISELKGRLSALPTKTAEN